MSHIAGCNHGLYFCAKHFFETSNDVDFKFVCVEKDRGIEEDLVGLAESEVELILVEQLFISLYILALLCSL